MVSCGASAEQPSAIPSSSSEQPTPWARVATVRESARRFKASQRAKQASFSCKTWGRRFFWGKIVRLKKKNQKAHLASLSLSFHSRVCAPTVVCACVGEEEGKTSRFKKFFSPPVALKRTRRKEERISFPPTPSSNNNRSFFPPPPFPNLCQVTHVAFSPK